MKLFHYTQVFHAVLILREGVIRRSKGKPALSSNPTHEPTARTIRQEQLVHMHGDEHARFAFSGWARFVFDGRVSIPWKELPLPGDVRGDLERKGKDRRSEPGEWFALDRDIRCTDLPLEIQTLFGWKEIADRTLKRRYADLKVMPDGISLGRHYVRIHERSSS